MGNPFLTPRHLQQLTVETHGPLPGQVKVMKGLVKGYPMPIPFSFRQGTINIKNERSGKASHGEPG
jgi:hypothetical protein